MKDYFNNRFESDLKFVFDGEDSTSTICLAPEAWQESPVRIRLGQIDNQFCFLISSFLLSSDCSRFFSSLELHIPKVYGILSGADIDYAPNIYLSAAVLWLQSDNEMRRIFHESPLFFEQEGFRINADLYNRLNGMANDSIRLFGNFTSTSIDYGLVAQVLKKLCGLHIGSRQ